MPLWDYECPKCHYKKEVLEKANAEVSYFCVPCTTKLVKVLSTSNFQFKGPGFYETDYKQKK